MIGRAFLFRAGGALRFVPSRVPILRCAAELHRGTHFLWTNERRTHRDHSLQGDAHFMRPKMVCVPLTGRLGIEEDTPL